MAVMGNSGFWLAEPLKLFYSERKSPNDLKPTTKISHLILIQQDEEKMLVNFCANQMPGQLSLRKVARGEGWYPQFNPATFLCLFQARTWISHIICHGFF